MLNYRRVPPRGPAGYYVVAPDLLGHGFAARPVDYSIATFVEHLRPLLDSLPSLDLLVGHSLGGVVAVAIPAQYKQKLGFRMALLDPVLEFPVEIFKGLRAEIIQEVSEPLSVEQYQKENPRWTQEDCAIKVLGAVLCTPSAAGAICDVRARRASPSPWALTSSLAQTNFPGSFTHHLPLPSASAPSPYETIILGADPALGAAFSVEEARELAKSRPYVKTAFVKGATHSIHREEAELVVKVLVLGEVEDEGLLAAENVKVESGALQPEQM